MFSLTQDPLDLNQLMQQLSCQQSGGIVTFEGRVRDHNQGQAVSGLEYQVYPELALTEGQKILEEAKLKFNIHRCFCVHRFGMLKLEEVAVWIGVSAAHRNDAYLASRYIIDQIKLRLPIWKKEHYLNRPASWVFCRDHHTHVHLDKNDYYQKQSKIIDQNQLERRNILVIGAGGLAATALTNLVTAGVSHITIVDFDKVEVSNLHRQTLFTVSDIGEPKAQIAARKMQELNPFVKITPLVKRLDNTNYRVIFKDHHLIIDCSDNLETKMLIHDACFLLNIPFISAGVYRMQGQIRTFIPRQGGCLYCLPEFTPTLDEVIGNCNDAGVLGATVSMIGAMQSHEAIEWLLYNKNNSIDHTLFIDAQNLSINKIKNVKNPECLCCEGSINIDETKLDLTLLKAKELQADIIHIENFDKSMLELTSSKVLVIECQRGIRSRALVKKYRKAGFSNIYALRK